MANNLTARAPMKAKEQELMELTLQLRNPENDKKYAKFHGDNLIGNPITTPVGTWGDIKAALQPKNWPELGVAIDGLIKGQGLNLQSVATIAGSLSDYSTRRNALINNSVKEKYDKMLHPPLTYLGDAFQYRTADGSFNSAMNPHLGQAGAPYAKTVPSKTAPLGALPDPSDLFDKLMAREEGGRESQSGLSAMLLYHATIIIHDIFRTNDNDKNISDSSSYLDLSPLYGYTPEMVMKVRDEKYKLGLLKPDTFAEDRLLRQPPGVCIMLVMYNRYHNYAARQLLRINENGRFSIPKMYEKTKLVSLIQEHLPQRTPFGQKMPLDSDVLDLCKQYEQKWREARAARPEDAPKKRPDVSDDEFKTWSKDDQNERKNFDNKRDAALKKLEAFEHSDLAQDVQKLTEKLERLLHDKKDSLKTCAQQEDFQKTCDAFEIAWEAAWKKQDDDLFNTARLITCGMYIQVSVHDYLRALMGFHQFDTNFTLDPRADFDQKKTSRGIGNQVTVEFNLLYRFHCAISLRDEAYTERFMEKVLHLPKKPSLPTFLQTMAMGKQQAAAAKKRGVADKEPWEVTFGIPDDSDVANQPPSESGSDRSRQGSDSGISMDGLSTPETPRKPNGVEAKKLPSQNFTRNAVTNLFDDKQMLDELSAAMDAPLSNFGPRNVPKCLKAVEIMGITQARKWECGTLNDFRDFFGMARHKSFEDVTKNEDIQNALRDLYEHPDKIELYPGIFCESDAQMNLDPGPVEASSALWSAIFSDAITLVRSDRFYTTDWSTQTLTAWGMKEVTPNNEVCKSSVFHRLLQRAFPGWYEKDTIRFFHPFYTSKQNGIFAKAQGYANCFTETAGQTGVRAAVVAARSDKPPKPWYFDQFGTIQGFIDPLIRCNFKHPVFCYGSSLPLAMQQVLNPPATQKAPDNSPIGLRNYFVDNKRELKSYLHYIMGEMVKRESVAMTKSTFQIDATRDFAIPTVTRFVADFLGFGDKLRKVAGSKGLCENDIYQHITNCQIFLTYNTDETKFMQRRQAFQKSMQALIDLTEQGTIWEANRWGIKTAIFGDGRTEPKCKYAMFDLGVFVAKQVLAHEANRSKAAAILLLICLDFAYHSVVAFTATLDAYMKELYAAANAKKGELVKEPEWIRVQRAALEDDDDGLQRMVENIAQREVRLPLVRRCIKDTKFVVPSTGEVLDISEGQTVIIDLSKAIASQPSLDLKNLNRIKAELSLADRYCVFAPDSLSTVVLSSMIKFIAQMKNPRRGHDAQGKLKKIRLDSTVEGYANYMAPQRVKWIEHQVSLLKDANKDKVADKIMTEGILKPEVDTYLTPMWDEFVPFPMTWKIRFDGYGESNYRVGDEPYGRVKSAPAMPDFCPPWYQPQGASTTGGTFALTKCVCAPVKREGEDEADVEEEEDGHHDHHRKKEKKEKRSHECPCMGPPKKKHDHHHHPQLSTGCGMSK